MADSRFAARRLITQKWSISAKATQFIGVFILAFVLTEWIADETFTETAWYTLLLLFWAIGLCA